MFYGGTTSSHPGKRPVGTHLIPEIPSAWFGAEAEKPIVVRAEDGHLALFGMCGADDGRVRAAVRSGIPDTIAWRWPGCYFAVHVGRSVVRVWTDLGANPVYVRRQADGEIVWSTSARALASLHGEPAPDLESLTSFLQGNRVKNSLFTDVRLLPAGHRAHLVQGGCFVTPIWRPRPSPSAAHRLRRALESAVAVRVDGAQRPTCDLSGGLDSTSLALLAARRLAPLSRSITGTTLHPAGVTTGGDLDYVRATTGTPGLRHAWIGMDDDDAPYRGLASLSPTDEPAVSTISIAGFTAHMRWLADHRSDVHMTGDGGDALLITPPSYISEMFRRRRFLTGLKAASRFAQVRRLSLRQAIQHARAVPPERTELPMFSQTHHAMFGTLLESARSARADVEIAGRLGVRLTNPFFDAQVIDSYLSTPLAAMPGPAMYKPILVEGMRDVLPDVLTRRITKATTTVDHYEGLRRSLPEVETLIDGHLAEAGLINVSAVRAVLRRAAMGAADLSAVEPIVAAEAWWRALAPIPWREHA